MTEGEIMNGPELHCRYCGTRLRHAYNTLCDSCARTAGFRRPIPDGFYEHADLRAALARYDFGAVFVAVRKQTGMSQLQLADLLGLTQSRISAIERGERCLIHVRVAARLATVLGVPAPLLGFPVGPHTETTAGNFTAEEMSWLERRDFLALVTAATVGSSLHPELARLAALLPRHPQSVTRPRIGAADVDAIEAITDGFRRSDFAHGGGLGRAAAVAQLHQVRRLEEAACTPEIHTRLLVAIAELAGTAGWMSYDVGEHDAARRLWTYSVDTARRADDHPQATDLTVTVLLDMAHQALHLDRANEALRLTQFASATAANRRHPAGTTTHGYIFAVLGWCRAALGEGEPTHRALSQAQDTYVNADPATTGPWASFVTDAEITAQLGYSLYLLSLKRPEYAPEAVEKLTTAVAGYGADYERSRAVNLPPLASVQFQAGDLDAAVATGYDAVDSITKLSSTRGHARLRVLDAMAAPHSHKPDVADLRDHIRTTLTAAA